MPNKHNDYLIVCDWDDTLFPSSWVRDNAGIRGWSIHDVQNALSEEHRNKLKEVLEQIMLLINHLKNYGHVIIVTNSADGWVQKACDLFYEKNIIEGMEVVSAQHWKNNRYSEPRFWKTNFLIHYLKKNKQYKYIINFGDSEYDRETMHDLNSYFHHIKIKNVKFIDGPCADKLYSQIHFIINHLISSIFNKPSKKFIDYELHTFIDLFNCAEKQLNEFEEIVEQKELCTHVTDTVTAQITNNDAINVIENVVLNTIEDVIKNCNEKMYDDMS